MWGVRMGSCSLGISGPTAPSRPSPLDRASDSLIFLRLARDPPVGPRTNWPRSASPEAGLVPQPRRLRLKSLSGRLSHPINALGRTHYVTTIGSALQQERRDNGRITFFTIPTDNTGTVSCRRTSRTIPPDGY